MPGDEHTRIGRDFHTQRITYHHAYVPLASAQEKPAMDHAKSSKTSPGFPVSKKVPALDERSELVNR